MSDNPPYYSDDRVTVYHGDCLDVLRSLPDASVDSVVTDPPYGLEFMGKEWDKFGTNTSQGYREKPRITKRPDAVSAYSSTGNQGVNSFQAGAPFQKWCTLWAAECLRVLKPGGHMLAFGGTRTWHRLACAVEDAGFEVRDSIAWLYGSGFPKSLDVSKAIDKAAGAEREVTGSYAVTRDLARDGRTGDEAISPVPVVGATVDITAPATPDAERWQGWGTALKPAFEPVVVARKPLSGTVAQTVLQHGTGALNIDACRVEGVKGVPASPRRAAQGVTYGELGNDPGTSSGWDVNAGRWPANVILGHHDDCAVVGAAEERVGGGASGSSGFVDGYEGGDGWTGRTVPTQVWECVDGCQVAALDAQSGTLTSGKPGTMRLGKNNGAAYGAESRPSGTPMTGYGDTGGASRFFYTPKAAKSERPFYIDADGKRVAHPTVKPLALMRYLARLVTPPGGKILEPFAGSGTTVEAALLEGFSIIAIEREAEYLPFIDFRIARGYAGGPKPDDPKAATAAAVSLTVEQGALFGD